VADSKQPLAIDARPPQQHWGQDGLQRQSRRQSQTDLNQLGATPTPILSGSFRRALATICCTRASSALRPWNAQAVTCDLRVALHACHERFVSQVDLPAQPLPNGLSDALVDKPLISSARLFPRRTEREVM
jgi:hypothetical protein